MGGYRQGSAGRSLAVSLRLGHESVKITLDLYGRFLSDQDDEAAAAMVRFAAQVSR